MKKITERNLKVNYYEKEGNEKIWIAQSLLDDKEHEIELKLEIDMEQMLILQANIRFVRCPQEDCRLVEPLAKKLIGMKIDHYFSMNAMKIVMGPQGCPNIMTLLNISVPGIIYYYYPYQISTGKMTQDEFYEILREKERNACLAHTKMFGSDQPENMS
jgi:hypothetical protein